MPPSVPSLPGSAFTSASSMPDLEAIASKVHVSVQVQGLEDLEKISKWEPTSHRCLRLRLGQGISAIVVRRARAFECFPCSLKAHGQGEKPRSRTAGHGTKVYQREAAEF